MAMVEVRVHVPVDRETEFYRWFADWRDGAASAGDIGNEGATEATLQPAISWWRLLTPKESAIWSMWIDAAPSMVTADRIVHELDLKSSREIPGALAWSSRKGKRVGFTVDWRFRKEATGEAVYGIEDSAYAEMLATAREHASSPSIHPRIALQSSSADRN